MKELIKKETMTSLEIAEVTEAQAREAMRLAMHKLPVKSKFVAKESLAKGGEA